MKRYSNFIINLVFICFIFSCNQLKLKEQWDISAPAGNRYTEIKTTGETILPNGRIIKPMGSTFRIAPHPYGLVLSNDGKIAITANSGTEPFSITILENILSKNPEIRQIPNSPKTDDNLLAAVFMGLAISPDNKLVYVAGGTTNKVFVFEISTGKKVKEILANKTFDNQDFSDGYLGDLVLSKDGKKLYVVDQIGFRIAVIDTDKSEVIANLPTGRYPFGITLSPDEKTVFVANVGAFQYSYAKHIDLKNPKRTAMKFPAYGYNTKEMRDGIKNDSVDIPGLGDPNVPESFSVWGIDLANKKTIFKVKTGVLVGEKIDGIPAIGGASPNSLVATNNYVFVSNGNNDNISVIDVQKGKLLKNIDLQPDKRLGYYKGIIPFGLAISPDQKRLYVAESGINSVGIVDIPSKKVIGHLPVGWFPSKLKVTPDGKQLIVANAKGYGSGPNAGKNFKLGEEGSYIGNLMKGSVTVLDIPKDDELPNYTEKTLAYNFKFERKNLDSTKSEKSIEALPSAIKYIVFIAKENRTYDEVFGQLKNGNGDASLARYGKNVTFKNNAGNVKISNATIMPNHLALAQQFTTADNFYCDSDHSADGHRWLAGVYPNEWMETHVSAAYGGKRNFNPNSKAPGKFALNGSSGSFYPEDYNQHGSIWEHLERNQTSFYNFGFTTEQEGNFNDSTMKYGGELYQVNYPLPNPMFNNTSRKFPTYNTAIPDQFRVDVFKQEFQEKYLSKGKTMPQVLFLMLPNDHGAGERPAAGFPYRESYMADNDLALGRAVEFLSHTPYWKNMAIFVTEDDPQGGTDHIDAHRSMLQIYSPFAKKNYISHVHFSFGSMFKTFFELLKIPFLNQYDASATSLIDCFSNKPDFTPFNALAVDKRIFDPQKALDPFDEKFDWKALKEGPILDDDDYLEKDRDKEDKKMVKENEYKANPRLYKKKANKN